MKSYDKQYFDRWYHNPRSRIVGEPQRNRKIAMVLAAAEYILERRLQSVLDVGCGVGLWRPVLRRLRPRLTWTGVDSSEYAVRRYGKRRSIRLGSFGSLADVIPRRTYDLVVASDVIHYLSVSEFERGLRPLVERIGGVAYLDFFSSRDRVEGDMRGMNLRPPGYYLRLFRKHGLVPLGMQLYARRDVVANLAAMERIKP